MTKQPTPGLHEKAAMSTDKDAPAAMWRYDIQYGPEGEANYAWVYCGAEMVATMRTYNAQRICKAMNADLAHPPAKREAGENVDASILRERISRAIFDPGQTEGYKGERTLTDWQTDAVMRVLGHTPSAALEGSDNG